MIKTITHSSSVSMYREQILKGLLLISMLLITTMVFAQPANDNCITATVLNTSTGCSYGEYTLEGATLDAFPSYSSCANNPKREVWFKAAVPATGILVIQATTNINPIISVSVFTGSCGSLTYYDCTESLVSGTGYLSISIKDAALAGTDVYIEVARGNSNESGNFELCAFVQEAPSNEDSNDAVLLSNEKGTFEHQSYSNKYGTSTGQGTANCGTFSGADVWFKTMMPVTGRLVVHAQSDEISPVIGIYTGSSNSLVYETCATASGDETEVILNDVALADELIYIQVYADGNGTGGEFELLVLEPVQDFCAEAIVLDVDKATEEFESYTNRYASKSEDGADPSCGSYKDKDIWFTMEVPASGELIIDSKPSADLAIKPILTLYSGDCSSLTQVACDAFGSTNAFGAKINLSPSENLANQTVYLRMHNFSSDVGGAFDLSVHNPSAALPVELVNFTANTFNSTVVLDWTTATEENNDYFLVEHSTDGRNFIPIEKVDGYGTTTELQHYDYVHDDPFFGENYYRIKQVDFDGAFEYFEVVVAVVRLTEEQFKLFPNPAFTKDVVSLRWSEDLGEERLIVTVVDALGQKVYQREVENNGERQAMINFAEVNMNAGIYFLQLSNDQQVIAHRRFNLIVN